MRYHVCSNHKLTEMRVAPVAAHRVLAVCFQARACPRLTCASPDSASLRFVDTTKYRRLLDYKPWSPAVIAGCPPNRTNATSHSDKPAMLYSPAAGQPSVQAAVGPIGVSPPHRSGWRRTTPRWPAHPVGIAARAG